MSAYSAYHPQSASSHSQALRPTPLQRTSAYQPVDGHDAPSPVDSRPNPFATPFDHSSDNLSRQTPLTTHFDHSTDTLHKPYGSEHSQHFGSDHAGYAENIPMQNNPHAPPPQFAGDPKHGPLVGESAMSQEELDREQRRQRRWQRRADEKARKSGILGIGTGRIVWVVYIMTLIQIIVFIAEIVKNSILTGSPIETKPTFNIMIGPSPYVTINMGARYLPCMKDETANKVTPDLPWPCPNSTSIDPNDPHNTCSIAELCGNGAKPGDFPVMQWWRFISPIFLHVGLIHIGFNLLLQLTLGKEIERLIGSVRFFIVYMVSGIFGFILGGNFAAKGLSSMGASGSLFGILAISLLDLLYTWGQRRNPGKELVFLLLDIVISLVLGLLPGLDNFSHIGGLLMGLVLGICILRSPDVLRRRIMPTYDPHNRENESLDQKGRVRAQAADYSEFTKGPIGFFRGRTPYWWAWWLVRAACLIAVIVCFIVLINNFYIYENQCSWCKYLSCLPVTTNGINWCDLGTGFVQSSSKPQSSSIIPRGLLGSGLAPLL